MKLVVTGYARHGKDTVCEILAKQAGLVFTSSSRFVGEKAVRSWLEKKGITYESFEDMYEDRVNHRGDWFDAIAAYGKEDAARLGRELFEAGNDIYCGLRNWRELMALRKAGLVTKVIWVDASRRLPPEGADSMTIMPSDCDLILENNGTLEKLEERVIELLRSPKFWT